MDVELWKEAGLEVLDVVDFDHELSGLNDPSNNK